MAPTVYALCFLTSLACAVLLLRAARRAKSRFLMWCGFCFAGLAANNALLFIDLVLMPGPVIDLSIPRNLVTLVSLSLLVYGLVVETSS